ncbi:MAG: DUF480 domain-containing protein [Proteobacteria bacterium]|nr:DUF480 domain-containing protein [Pseudomonadota bacterium]
MSIPTLSALEARVVGVLVEKQRAVPDTYPLTLAALVAGCNQKTSRHPVMAAADADVQAALDRLKDDAWIVETSGGRVMRYAHNVERVLDVPAQSAALLAVLLLRGPQTAAELRVNCDRLHRFADVGAVEAFLHELAQRRAGALVAELPRTPGTRETRWTQRLSGPAAGTTPAGARPDHAHLGGDIEPPHGRVGDPREDSAGLHIAVDELRADVADLRSEVDRLRETVAALCAKLAT